jgi:hypothetical protein
MDARHVPNFQLQVAAREEWRPLLQARLCGPHAPFRKPILLRVLVTVRAGMGLEIVNAVNVRRGLIERFPRIVSRRHRKQMNRNMCRLACR